MKLPIILFSICAVSSTMARPSEPSNQIRQVGAKRLYSTWMADSIYARGQGLGLSDTGTPRVSYEHGTFQHALRELYAVTQNETYLAWVKQGIDTVVTDTGNIIGNYNLSQYTLDDVRLGESLIKLYQATNDTRYSTAAATFRSQLLTHPRTAEGGYWHKLRYPNQQWLDGVYMAHSFYALYASVFEGGNTTVFDDIGLQFSLIWDHCQDEGTGLLRHGYDYSKAREWADPVTGASPEVWDRAMGWYMMALVDMLEQPSAIPSDHPTYKTLLLQLQTLTPAVVKMPTPIPGMVPHDVPAPRPRRNYIESSGTSMFVYALLKAVRLGFVQDVDGSVVASAKKGYGNLVEEHIIENANGTLSLNGTVRVGSLDLAGNYEYYIGINTVINDLKGTAPFVMASLEYERLPVAK